MHRLHCAAAHCLALLVEALAGVVGSIGSGSTTRADILPLMLLFNYCYNIRFAGPQLQSSTQHKSFRHQVGLMYVIGGGGCASFK